MLISLIMFSGNAFSQEDGAQGTIDRQPYAAGRFYEDDPGALKENLRSLFEKAESKKFDKVAAVISPHAGYPFSGEVAASVFNQLDKEKQYDRIFILASSHSMSFSGASIYSAGNYITPLGEVPVDLDLAKKLTEEHDIFTFRRDAHTHEHSLEVQLPFLQYILEHPFKLVPVLVGTRNTGDCKKIAEALQPYLGGDDLFVVSTDFSHYPAYEDAKMIDEATANAIVSMSPEALQKVLQENDRKGISNLATSLCGWSSVYSLLYMINDSPGYSVQKVKYMNSGDARFYGDKSRVVGYYGLVVTGEGTQKKNDFRLSEKGKAQLMHIARKTLGEFIHKGTLPDFDEKKLAPELLRECGAFVTLEKEGNLRGCIGRFQVDKPLYLVVRDMTVSASTQDYRFPRVTPEEVGELDIEISVLTPLRKIQDIEEIEMGRHGIYIKKGTASGTFLPQVAQKTGWSREEFLGHCAEDKARIGWDGWKDADVFVYEAIIFSEDETPE